MSMEEGCGGEIDGIKDDLELLKFQIEKDHREMLHLHELQNDVITQLIKDCKLLEKSHNLSVKNMEKLIRIHLNLRKKQ